MKNLINGRTSLHITNPQIQQPAATCQERKSWVSAIQRRWGKLLVAIALFLVLVIIPLPVSAQSQNTAETADVVIDGRVLFQLRQIDSVSAEERADVANKALWQVIESSNQKLQPSPIRVRTQKRNGLVTVRASNRHILTVTSSDLLAGIDAEEQAETWARELQVAIVRAQQERQPAYQKRMAGISAGVLTIALLCWIFIDNGRRWLWRRQNRTDKPLSLWLLPSLLCAQIFVWLVTAVFICELFPAARSARYRFFQFLERIFTSPLVQDFDGQGYSLLNLVQFLLLTLVLWIGVQVLTSALERLVTQMRSENGLDIQDRRFRLTVYSQCFIGSEAVTWLTRTQNATRKASVRLGQALIEQGIFHHVTDEHPFKDEYLFYRFYEDE